MSDNFPVLTEEQVAEMLQISVYTLAEHRKNGCGEAPPHVKVGGKVRYVKGTVERWLKEKESA